MLRDPEGRVTLAPSYDHGNSLGFNLTDKVRIRELAMDPPLVRWASRGFADRFERCQQVTLVDFAERALRQATQATRDYWRRRLAQITTADWETLINRTPEMSEACRTFSIGLLITNQRRLLDGV